MNSKKSRNNLILLLLTVLFYTTGAFASGVIINGRLLSHAEKTVMENAIGTHVEPGNYLSDGDCWVNLSNGTSGCLSSDTVNTYSRYGSGDSNTQGNWNHWSDAAGGAVGGTSDGCIYTSFGWSSC